MRRITFILIFLLMFQPFAFALEDLDELEARTSRKSANTFYSGEDSGNYYIWQPQIVGYVDTTTDHEVFIWTQTDDEGVYGSRYSASEYNIQIWSADGKRIAYYQDEDTGAYTRTGHPWLVGLSDGSNVRPIPNSASRASTRRFYYDWSPTVPDVAYTVGANYDANTGQDENGVYREVHTNTAVTSTLIVDMIGSDTSTERHGGLKDNLTADGLYYMAGAYAEDEPYYIVRVEPAGSRALTLSWDLPTLDTHWYALDGQPTDGHMHDQGLVGNADEGYWWYIMPSESTGQGAWWRLHLWGSDSGAPDFTEDDSSPYDWWVGNASQTEIQIVGHEYGQAYGNSPAFTTDEWWSHSSFDRWGKYVVYSDVENSPIGPGAMRISDYTQTGLNTLDGGCQYSSWTAWSDYFVSATDSPADRAGLTKYNSTTNSDHETLAYLHTNTTGDFQNPGQSPDGTKATFRSDWLNPTAGIADLFVVVAYYPHPPQITACTASSGVVTTTFEWMLDSTPRGYTERGWPNEDTDGPPPPRETELFRLWRSSDKVSWTPLGTVTSNIFDRYDFSDGTWDGADNWSITDVPGDGTWYYIVTSKEWSGLESHALSNIYSITVSGSSGTGTQDTAYPASPGDLDNISASDFHSSFSTNDPSIIKAYNIYANDGSAPSAQQQDLIATIPVDACSGGDCQWVDWLGNTGETTQYIIAAVDTQGNISGSTYVTNQSTVSCESGDCSAATPEPTADGQYLVSWDDMYEAYEGITSKKFFIGSGFRANGKAWVFE